jgi:Domain of unknown function (DUF4296)
MMMLLLASCQDATMPAPLEKSKMVDVMADIRILEGSYAAMVTKPDTLRPYMAKYYAHVFERHHITHEQYIQAYQYYMAQPVEMEAIEDSVINRITAQLNALQNQ